MKKLILGVCIMGILSANDQNFEDFKTATDNLKDGHYKTAIELFEKACKNNIAQSCSMLSFMHLNGIGTKKDMNKAISYLKKACKLGDKDSCYYLENLDRLEDLIDDQLQANEYGGKEVHKNLSKLYNKEEIENLSFKDQNIKDFKTALDYLYDDRYKEAIELFKKTCDNGISESCNIAAYLHSKEIGTKKDMNKAISYLKKACRLGDDKSCLFIYDIDGFKELPSLQFQILEFNKKAYENASKLEQNFKNNLNDKDLKNLIKSCDEGDDKACYLLGEIYENAKGVKPDFKKAISFYEKSSKLGNANAYFDLGIIYGYGINVKPDFKKAIKFYEKACELGNANAYYHLAVMYEYGKGFKIGDRKAFILSIKKANELYEKACELGNASACLSLGNIYKYGIEVKLDYIMAIKLYEKACELGNARACAFAAVEYALGYGGINKDLKKSLEFYKKSCDLGYTLACHEYNNVKDIIKDLDKK